MKSGPSERLDPRARTLWRIGNALRSVPILVAGGVASWLLLQGSGVAPYVSALPFLAAVVFAVVAVGVTPALSWRRWRYEIHDDEVDLQRGIFWTTRTLVPLTRIQHVDTRSGPLQRRYGLATVTFYTAAGANHIPELAAPVAAGVRDRIAALTKDQDEL